MGRQDKKFTNSRTRGRQDWSNRGEVVFSDDGYPRYLKRFKANGGRRYGQFSMRPENRDTTGTHQKQFNTKRRSPLRRQVGYKQATYGNRAD